MKKQKLIGLRRTKGERGFSLLEYAGGAAVIAGVIFVTFRVFGDRMNDLFTSLNNWLGRRITTIDAAD